MSTILLVSLCSCATAVDPRLLQRAQEIPLVEARVAEKRPHEKLGAINGLSCAMGQGSRPKMAEAEANLKLEAAKLGGDAVSFVRCAEGGTDWSNNCWNTIKCQAQALKWKENEGSGDSADANAGTNR